MCGIAGCIIKNSDHTFHEEVERMKLALTHRGPNDQGQELAGQVHFAHTRLSILDLSISGKQPMWNKDKTVLLVLNGEIYNYKELKKELAAYPFKSETDTEVVLAAYANWGHQFLEHIDGMFALALYDTKSKETILARDRFGKKPLYYHENKNGFWFSSEIRSLLSSGELPRKINRSALGYYLQYQTVHYPETMVKDVWQLEPGSALIIKDKDIQKANYFQKEESSFSSTDNLKTLFEESVQKRLMSDVPLAILLSAGIDSNLILAAASKQQKVDTFTIGFKEKDFDESALAEKSAKHFGANFHKIILEPQDFLHELKPALQSMDHPSGDGPNTYTVCKEVKKAGFTVALSGLGGDEVFLGYQHYKQLHQIRNSAGFKLIPKKALQWVNSLFAHRKLAKLYDLKKVMGETHLALSSFRSNYNKKQMEDLFGEKYRAFSTKNKTLESSLEISVLEMDYYMHDVLLRDADQMSMANAVELRNPFLDKKLVAFAMQNKLLDMSFPKKALYQSLGDMLPSFILDKKKTGFTFPWEQWMRKELNQFCKELMQDLEEFGIFKSGSIAQIWNEFESGSKLYTWSRVWPLVCLSYWIKQNAIEK